MDLAAQLPLLLGLKLDRARLQLRPHLRVVGVADLPRLRRFHYCRNCVVHVLVGHDQMETTVVAGGGADLMADVLSAVAKGAVLLTGLTTEQVLRTAKVAGVLVVVFVRGKRPDEPVIELARSYNMPVLLTRYSLFVASGRLYMNGLRGLDGSW